MPQSFVIVVVNSTPLPISADWIRTESYSGGFEQLNSDKLLEGWFPHIAQGPLDLSIYIAVPYGDRPLTLAYLTLKTIMKTLNAMTPYSEYPDYLKFSSYIGVRESMALGTIKSISSEYDNNTKTETLHLTFGNIPTSVFNSPTEEANTNVIPPIKVDREPPKIPSTRALSRALTVPDSYISLNSEQIALRESYTASTRVVYSYLEGVLINQHNDQDSWRGTFLDEDIFVYPAYFIFRGKLCFPSESIEWVNFNEFYFFRGEAGFILGVLE